MRKIASVLFALLCATSAGAGTPQPGCLMSANIGRALDPKHPLIDGLGSDHITGMHVAICARHPSGEVVTRRQAIDAARAFLKDNALDCRLADTRQFQVGGHKEDLEWNIDMECDYNAKSPLMVPPPPVDATGKQ